MEDEEKGVDGLSGSDRVHSVTLRSVVLICLSGDSLLPHPSPPLFSLEGHGIASILTCCPQILWTHSSALFLCSCRACWAASHSPHPTRHHDEQILPEGDVEVAAVVQGVLVCVCLRLCMPDQQHTDRPSTGALPRFTRPTHSIDHKRLQICFHDVDPPLWGTPMPCESKKGETRRREREEKTGRSTPAVHARLVPQGTSFLWSNLGVSSHCDPWCRYDGGMACRQRTRPTSSDPGPPVLTE